MEVYRRRRSCLCGLVDSIARDENGRVQDQALDGPRVAPWTCPFLSQSIIMMLVWWDSFVGFAMGSLKNKKETKKMKRKKEMTALDIS